LVATPTNPGPIMTDFTPLESGLGGALIGAASALLLLVNGRIAGISNIVGGLVDGRARGDRAWRGAFFVGLLVGGLALGWVLPSAFAASPVAWPAVVAAGLLVGFGTRMGSGCTSGHGICGISRLSARSIVATLTFMATGMATVLVVRHLLG
jgi:uncharacterized membrane protein YedE/YeeE